MIEVDRRAPRHGRVAGEAIVGAQNVVGGFGRSTHRRAHAMALLAVTRRALKNCIDVAGFARQVAMLAGELETCGQMIEKCALRGHAVGAERAACQPPSRQAHRCERDPTGRRCRPCGSKPTSWDGLQIRPTLPARPGRSPWCDSARSAAQTARHAHRPFDDRKCIPGQLHLGGRLAMTVGTLQLGVRTEQSKTSLLEMIVLPQCPTVGAMATVALFAQSPFVDVVPLMAIDAARFGLAECLGAVALSATHHIM